jgi:hypothetical protein
MKWQLPILGMSFFFCNDNLKCQIIIVDVFQLATTLCEYNYINDMGTCLFLDLLGQC